MSGAPKVTGGVVVACPGCGAAVELVIRRADVEHELWPARLEASVYAAALHTCYGVPRD